ncbi:hypothetical protein Dda_9467 [Drechslerella dactyloides]|uniref:Uncharacterized protein n=1 Tax=Drechslerella dactyloides TaxID=74499 RepID=A0AAD6IPF8_DREDA|nr:hypothetical protein Dda_9467 [Drechslerella dactyloides]
MATGLKTSDYSVGWICSVPIELAAVRAILDETHPPLDVADGDTNVYTFGRIDRHNVVIACLPEGRYGVTRASIAATHMCSTFTRLRFGLMYDFGKAMENGKIHTHRFVKRAPSILLSAAASTKAMDQAELGEKLSDAARKVGEDMRFHYPVGTPTDRSALIITTWPARGVRARLANYATLPKRMERSDAESARKQEVLLRDGGGGPMDDFPCLVIRGICDPDGHKNKRWQPYCALIAVVYAKELLLQVPTERTKPKMIVNSEGGSTGSIFVVPFRMPFPRNCTFVGRTEELGRIHKYFSDLGKTQIAIEYVCRHRRDYAAVFWVSTASEDSIRTSFIDTMQYVVQEQARITWPESAPDYQAIGFKLGMPGLADSKGVVSADPEAARNIQSALFRWLQLPAAGPSSLQAVDRSFPGSAEQTALDGLDNESAVRLLSNWYTINNEARTLVEKLGFMSLAIGHAGCYICEAKIPLGEYSSHYDEAFMSTWEPSFLQIEKQDAEAASLLLTCSYLNPGDIFENLWEDEPCDRISIRERVLLLASYSLVRLIRFGLFSVHPVVHSWTRGRAGEPERFRAIRHAVNILGRGSQQEKVSRQSGKWDGREGG